MSKQLPSMKTELKKDVLNFDFTEIMNYKDNNDFKVWSEFLNTLNYEEGKTIVSLLEIASKFKYISGKTVQIFYFNKWVNHGLERYYITTYIKYNANYPARKNKMGFYDVNKNRFFFERSVLDTVEERRLINILEYTGIDSYGKISYIMRD